MVWLRAAQSPYSCAAEITDGGLLAQSLVPRVLACVEGRQAESCQTALLHPKQPGNNPSQAPTIQHTNTDTALAWSETKVTAGTDAQLASSDSSGTQLSHTVTQPPEPCMSLLLPTSRLSALLSLLVPAIFLVGHVNAHGVFSTPEHRLWSAAWAAANGRAAAATLKGAAAAAPPPPPPVPVAAETLTGEAAAATLTGGAAAAVAKGGVKEKRVGKARGKAAIAEWRAVAKDAGSEYAALWEALARLCREGGDALVLLRCAVVAQREGSVQCLDPGFSEAKESGVDIGVVGAAVGASAASGRGGGATAQLLAEVLKACKRGASVEQALGGVLFPDVSSVARGSQGLDGVEEELAAYDSATVKFDQGDIAQTVGEQQQQAQQVQQQEKRAVEQGYPEWSRNTRSFATPEEQLLSEYVHREAWRDGWDEMQQDSIAAAEQHLADQVRVCLLVSY